jgi:HSP20 family protein
MIFFASVNKFSNQICINHFSINYRRTQIKREAIAAIIVLGIQTYILNKRLNLLSGQISQSDGFRLAPPKLPKPVAPTPNDDKAWNPYEEIQRIQHEMEQAFGDSLSRFHMNSTLRTISKIPYVDLQDKADRYVVIVNAPGAYESSLDVKLRRLTVTNLL